MKGVSPSHKGRQGASPVILFSNWIASECISKPISVILQANFNFISAISYISMTRFLQT